MDFSYLSDHRSQISYRCYFDKLTPAAKWSIDLLYYRHSIYRQAKSLKVHKLAVAAAFVVAAVAWSAHLCRKVNY